MREVIAPTCSLPACSSQDVLTDILRSGAQQLLAQAIEAEVAEWIEAHQHLTDEAGDRQVVRNGRLPKRTILTGLEWSTTAVSERASLALLSLAGLALLPFRKRG